MSRSLTLLATRLQLSLTLAFLMKYETDRQLQQRGSSYLEHGAGVMAGKVTPATSGKSEPAKEGCGTSRMLTSRQDRAER